VTILIVCDRWTLSVVRFALTGMSLESFLATVDLNRYEVAVEESRE